ERVQRKLHYALIDEVDSILIDEARTPLIISGPTEDSSDLYKKIEKLIPNLKQQVKEDSNNFQGEGHFTVDEKSRQVTLTERGLELVESSFTCCLRLGINFSIFLYKSELSSVGPDIINGVRASSI
ncbi:MAG: hypothetical protein ACTS8Y_00650, partial [Arsenophonus sp. ER-EMS1-MAG3]